MGLDYLAYCAPGSPFYDAPSPGDDDLVAHAGTAPEGWRTEMNEQWHSWHPPGVNLPGQGWKIHVSATASNCRSILDRVLGYCRDNAVPVKFLRSTAVLASRNSKYGDRGSSGKFITVYPPEASRLGPILNDLDDLVGGEDGPSILSDLRWRRGPVYVRYGGFTLVYGRDAHGRHVPCITAPDGSLVPDERRPGFHPPAWVELPSVVQEAMRSRESGVLVDFPFTVDSALHFSNGGGVYRATDTRTGDTVLLKEGRPHAGLDETGSDAVARLATERDMLRRLEGAPGVPRVIEDRRGHEHQFLIRDFVEGVPLVQEIHRRNPALPGAESMDPDAYTDWASSVLRQVQAGVDAMHERGVVFGDLHPGNIIVSSDGAVGFIDFESASLADDDRAQSIGAPGFRAPLGWSGRSVDDFALANLRLALFLPLTETLAWAPHLPEALARSIESIFPRAGALIEPAARFLRAPGTTDEGPASPVGNGPRGSALGRGVLSSATPERRDRLYPGDIGQFRSPTAGLEFAFGAAGVQWAAHVTGQPVPRAHVEWLRHTADDNEALGPGLFEGRAGIALALIAAGETDAGARHLDIAKSHPVELMDGSLWRGIPGLGLCLADAGTDTAQVVALGAALRDRVREESTGAPGLFEGGAGRALFFARLAALTADDEWIDDAVRQLDRDLGLLGWRPGVEPDARSPWHNPMLSGGAAGCALAAREILAHRQDDRLRALVEAVRDTSGPLCRGMLTHSGVLRGRAGTAMALRTLWRGEEMSDAAAGALRRLDDAMELSVVPLADGGALAFGDMSLRLSADWATGAAGLQHACAVIDGGAPLLPVLSASLLSPTA